MHRGAAASVAVNAFSLCIESIHDIEGPGRAFGAVCIALMWLLSALLLPTAAQLPDDELDESSGDEKEPPAPPKTALDSR